MDSQSLTNQSIQAAQELADLLATSKVFQIVFQGEPGATVLGILEDMAGIKDVCLPGQSPDFNKPCVDPLELAVREGRRQMLNLILWHLNYEENKREEDELRAQQMKEVLDGSKGSASRIRQDRLTEGL